MKPKIPQQISSCSTCSLSCIGQQKHTGKHQKISLPILRELILYKINSFDIKQIEEINPMVTDLKNMKDFIDNCLNDIQKKWSQEISSGLKGDNYRALKVLMEGDDLSGVTCKQVNSVQTVVGDYNDKQSKVIAQEKVEQMRNKLVVEFGKYQQKYKKIQNLRTQKQTKQTKQTVKSEIKYQKNEQAQLVNTHHSQLRPERSPILPQKNQNRDKNKNDKNDNEKTIKQLVNLPQNTFFTITLKVIKFINYFKIQRVEKIRFIGADSTGKAVCVIDSNHNIQVGKSIRIYDCKIYNFHGNQKQIQDGKYCRVDVVPDIGYTNSKFDLSRSYQNNQQQKDQPVSINRRERRERRDEIQNRRGRSRQIPEKKSKSKSPHSIAKSPSHSKSKSPKIKSSKSKSPKISPPATANKNIVSSPNKQISERTKREQKTDGIEYKKIKDIEPGDQDINLIAKVHEVLQTGKRKMVCYMGDETGIIKAELPVISSFVRQGVTLRLIKINCPVVKEHILVVLKEDSKLESCNLQFPKINISLDVSSQEWESENEDSDAQ